MSINVQLPRFEGPLALLLYLIRKEEMDIMDIKVTEITKQYLEYIKLMKELDLEVAGEFIAMAATLIQIKSRMLLPQYDENGEVIDVEDPRKELVQKLLEYQKYQEAAKLLYERPLRGRDFWTRGVREEILPYEEEIEMEENALFGLISSYRRVIKSALKRVHKVTAKAQSIASRILELKDILVPGRRVGMSELIQVQAEDQARQVLITFLSMLELGRMGFISLFQSEIYSEIWVEAKRKIESDVIGGVQEYDSIDSEKVAESMLADAAKTNSLDALEQFTDEQILAGESDSSEQLVLHDQSLNQDLEEPIAIEEMASDEEILAAELALDASEEGQSV